MQKFRFYGVFKIRRHIETFDWCCQYLNTLTAETACSPAEADLMCVTNGHISSQKITLVFFIMKITGPDLITEVLWRNLRKTTENVILNLH